MESKTFIIKKGRTAHPLVYLFIATLPCYFYLSKEAYDPFIPLLLFFLFLSMPVFLLHIILIFKWIFRGYAVKINEEKKELLLNHNLAFSNKSISLDNISYIDSNKREITISDPIILSKWERLICKASNSYKIRFDIISDTDLKKLFDTLLILK